MQKYYMVHVNNYSDLSGCDEVEHLAMTQFGSTGIEEFSIDEPQVDQLLGKRSYSGADIPESVIDEVSQRVLSDSNSSKTFYFDNEQNAKNFTAFLNSRKIKATIEQKDAQDWNEEWKKNYRPISVNELLEIIPSWDKENYNSKAENQIYIYPGMGFGTGSHETTFLCLRLMFETNLGFEDITCMDFGCGSGILGLALRKIKSKSKVDLYDIDSAALENCMQNVELNEINNSNIRYLLPKDKKDFYENYNLVFANILKNVLEHEQQLITSLVSKGGSLIVSGLLDGQQQDIIDLYTKKDRDLVYVKQEELGDWVALLFKKEI
jgi:ribosomal protein L11 methyltransferase